MWFRTTSPSDTQAFAAALARVVRTGDTIVLTGEMGAGKTVVAQGIGAALGVTEPMTSPTFTLVNTYECGDLTVHHADLYRLDRTVELLANRNVDTVKLFAVVIASSFFVCFVV